MSSVLGTVVYRCDGPTSLTPELRAVLDQAARTRCEVLLIGADPAREITALGSQRDLAIRVIDARISCASHALNRALETASGGLVVFINERMMPGESWLSDLLHSSAQHPDRVVFCGPTVPRFPLDAPSWAPQLGWSPIAFHLFTLASSDSALSPDAVPPGVPFGIRASARGARRFRTDLGWSVASPLLCEDVDFRRQMAGQTPVVFVPSASAVHLVTAEAVTPSFQYERAFQFGRSLVVMNGHIVAFPWVDAPGRSRLKPVTYFDAHFRLNVCYGELFELDLAEQSSECQILYGMICALGWSGEATGLAASAARWLAAYPAYVPPAARERFAASRSREPGWVSHVAGGT